MYLCAVAREHPDELEADMQEAYGIDIRRPGCSAAHLACLAAQLGPSSRVARAGDPRAAWGDSEYLLALVVDNVAAMRYENGGCKGRPPKPVQRPKARRDERDGNVHMSKERLDAILGAPRT